MWSWFRRRPRPEAKVSERRLPLSSSGQPTARLVAELEAAAAQGDAVAMANLGTARFVMGDRAGALHWLGMAWNAGNVAAGFNLGTLHSQAGDTNSAQVIWEQSAALGDPDAMLGLVKQALDRGDSATVKRWAPLILAQDAAFPITALGVAFRDHGDVARAVHAFFRAEELGDAYAMEYRARILDTQGAHDEATALRARAAKAERMM